LFYLFSKVITMKWEPPRTTAQLCPSQDMNSLNDFLKLQYGEDKILLQWFNGLCKSTFIEIGALDGILGSNSFFSKKN
jgi:hypothetical protein